MAEYNMKMVRGNTLAFGMEIEGLDQELDEAYFSVKTSYSEATYVLQKTIGDGIVSEGGGVYKIRVAPADTENVAPGRYYYDLEIEANGDIYTILRGILDILPDVTREE